MATSVKRTGYPHTPDYVTLLPPGEILAEKMSEMGIDAAMLAERCGLPIATIQAVLNAETAVSQEIAEKLEKATWIPAQNWLRHEESYRKNLEYSKQHPEIPAH